MKKLITWTSLILAVSLFAEPGNNKGQLKKSMKAIPLSSIYLSTENGGTNHASAALSDGIGIYTTQEDEYAKAIAYLNGKYGDDALKDEKSLKDYVLDTGTVADKELANKLDLVTAQKSNPGDSCDDGDEGTTGDVYVDNNFTCKGQNSVIGAPCDDINPQTKNDVYTDINFTCKGVLTRSESKCFGDEIGSEFLVNGVYYLVVDNDTIKNNLNRAETLCTSNVNDMSSLFDGNKAFNSDISKWDTSNVTNMSAMFESATSFNQPIGNWNTSKVTAMSYMFLRAGKFNQSIGNWNTSKVALMGNMFREATSFNKPIGSWNTSKVIQMQGMFMGATSFNQPIGNWDTSEIEVNDDMFWSAKAFNQDLSNWCMFNVTKKPNYFDYNTPNWNKTNRQPIWGTCPGQ